MKLINIKQDLGNVCSLINKKRSFFMLSSLIDLGFFVAIFSSLYGIAIRIVDVLVLLSSRMGVLNNLPSEVEGQLAAYTSILENTDFVSLYSDLLSLLMLLAFTIFIIWIFFQGMNFFIASKIVHGKAKFWKYIGKFSLFYLCSYLFVLMSFWFTVFLLILNSKMIIPIFSQWMVNFVLIFLLVVIKYFFFISAVKISRRGIGASFKDTFRTGVKRFPRILLSYLSASVAVVFSALVILLFSKVNLYLVYTLLMVLFIPSVTFARITLFYLIDKVHS